MKTKELAALLQGMELKDFPTDLMREARRYGLVVVIGVSSDTVELYGAIEGEADVPEGGIIYVDADGLLPDAEEVDEADQRAYYDRKRLALPIDAEWQKDGFAWIFSMVPPHSRFVATLGGQRYSRGIVFDLASAGL